MWEMADTGVGSFPLLDGWILLRFRVSVMIRRVVRPWAGVRPLALGAPRGPPSASVLLRDALDSVPVHASNSLAEEVNRDLSLPRARGSVYSRRVSKGVDRALVVPGGDSPGGRLPGLRAPGGGVMGVQHDRVLWW